MTRKSEEIRVEVCDVNPHMRCALRSVNNHNGALFVSELCNFFYGILSAEHV